MDIGAIVKEIEFLEKLEQFYIDYESKNGNVFTDLEWDVIEAIQDRLDELENCMCEFERDMIC